MLGRLLGFAIGSVAFLAPTLMATAAAQDRPPGQFRPRPGAGREPEFPPPTILEYKPRSTLVVPANPVPRAKFPAVDFHGHPPALTSQDVINSVGAAMDSLNLQVMVVSGRGGEQLRQQIEAVKASRYRDRFVFFTNLNLRDVGPGSGARIAAQLEADIKAGAVGVGEIGKGFGLSFRKADGTRLTLDDPELDPVWETAARLKIPVFIHVADPSEFFQPIDYENERWLELALFPDRRYNDRSRYPSFEQLAAERDRLFERHPKTIWVLAHLGWHANDLARLGRMFDRMPNLYSEVGAVLYDLGRQPRTARDFFTKYQDRLLFGKDSFQPDEYPYFWRVFETEDEYFDYYRDYHAFWKMYGMGLPDPVLRKIYFENARKLLPTIAAEGFPGQEPND
ncbi:MAG TPA: amidohydrolase family protein [Gemmatimonadales bacterium]|nr:amidohydrolase family protein [Gemmatimonadales bacterium]